jgi:hypothetical protein
MGFIVPDPKLAKSKTILEALIVAHNAKPPHKCLWGDAMRTWWADQRRIIRTLEDKLSKSYERKR